MLFTRLRKILDNYWTEENRFPFFIKAGRKLAGFVMVSGYAEVKLDTKYTMTEFFIMYKYRRLGIGKYAVKYIFDKYKGKWQLKFHPKNNVSANFWMTTINEYTNGNFEIIENDPMTVYDDGTLGKVLIFYT